MVPSSYLSLDARVKRRFLWEEITRSDYRTQPGGALPKRWPDRKVVEGRLLAMRANVEVLTSVHDTWETPRERAIHTYGSVAKVELRPVAGARYTGLFGAHAFGLLRLSYAYEPGTRPDDAWCNYHPGAALKLFVRGRPSENLHFLHAANGTASGDLVGPTLYTAVPAPSPGTTVDQLRAIAQRSLDVLQRDQRARAERLACWEAAAVHADGAPEPTPVAPERLEWRWSADAVEAWRRLSSPRLEFREVLELLDREFPDLVLASLWAAEADGAREIAVVELGGPFVASSFGDQSLFFRHAWREP